MTRDFVLDNSVVMAWAFKETASDYARGVLELLAGGRAVVPGIWPLEVTNVLLTAERRRRLPHAEVVRFLQLVRSLPILVEPLVPEETFGDIFSVARETGLSSYDASYLELAMREGMPLASLDKDLNRAARKCEVPIVEV